MAILVISWLYIVLWSLVNITFRLIYIVRFMVRLIWPLIVIRVWPETITATAINTASNSSSNAIFLFAKNNLLVYLDTRQKLSSHMSFPPRAPPQFTKLVSRKFPPTKKRKKNENWNSKRPKMQREIENKIKWKTWSANWYLFYVEHNCSCKRINHLKREK